LLDWLSGRLEPLGDTARRSAFVAAVRGNLMFPADADPLVALVCDADVACDAEAGRELAAAGADFFGQALAAWRGNAPDFKAWTRAVGAATGRKGAALYMPLRAALTGSTHGPELAPLVALMGEARVAARLATAGARVAAP
jgi:glutamyl-tRNA synthetase